MADAWARVRIAQGDITKWNADAIVNAANEGLLGGGGVDGAIHRAAGQADLQAACRSFGHCPTGGAVITPGFALAARHIIHTVGPVYGAKKPGVADLLASCYRTSLSLAVQNACRTVVFPAISTGVYGYPFDEATRIALTTVIDVLRETDALDEVTLIFFSAEDHAAARRIFDELRGG